MKEIKEIELGEKIGNKEHQAEFIGDEKLKKDVTTIELQKGKLMRDNIQLQCVANTHIFYENGEYKSYSCTNCPNQMEYICKYCYDSCHKSHHYGAKVNASLSKQTSIANQMCQCALNDHVVAPMQKSLLIEEMHKQSKEFDFHCPLNDIIGLTNPVSYYISKTDGKFYCLYCIFYCGEEQQELTNYEEKSSNVVGHPPQCNCSSGENHIPFYENIHNLISCLSDCRIASKLNYLKFPYQIFNNQYFLEKFFQDFIFVQKELAEKIPVIGNIKGQQTFSTKSLLLFASREVLMLHLDEKIDWKLYSASSELIFLIGKIFNSKMHLPLAFESDSFANFIDYNILINLLPVNGNNYTQVFKIKINCVKLYRKYYLNPTFLTYSDSLGLTVNDNASTFHRIFLCPLKMKEEDTLGRVQTIANKIFKLLNDELDNKSIDEKDFLTMCIEFLKFEKLILHRCAFDHDAVREQFKKIEKVVAISKSKKGLEFTIKKTLEKLIDIFCTITNDFIFYKKVLLFQESTENQREDNSKNKEAYKGIYCFQNEDFNKRLIETLFCYPKDTNDSSLYLLSNCFYDNLINSYDYYIQPLENLAQCEMLQGMIDEDFIYLTAPHQDFERFINCEKFPIQEKIDKLNVLLEKLSSLTYAMITGREPEDRFLSYLDGSLQDIFKFLQETFLPCVASSPQPAVAISEQPPGKKGAASASAAVSTKTIKETFPPSLLFKVQILFAKLNGINILLNIQKIVNHIEPIFANKNRKELSSIRGKFTPVRIGIYNILNLISQDNPFIACLFFNHASFEVLMGADNPGNLLFFYDQLKVLEKFKYNINTEAFVKNVNALKIIQEKPLRDNFAEVEIILKTFVLVLKVTGKKNLMAVNDMISFELSRILENNEFKKTIDLLQSEDEAKKRKQDVKKGDNLDEYTLKRSGKETITEQLLQLVYTCINNLKHEYFYLLNPKLYMDKICKVLEMYDHLKPELRRILTRAYSRYFIESNFTILKIIPDNLGSYMKEVNINLVEKAAEYSPAASSQAKSDTKSEIKRSGSIVSRALREALVKQKAGLSPLIGNLEKLRSFFTVNEKEYQNKLKDILNYFEHVIFFPSFFSIHKVTYFSKNVAAQQKYVVYTVIYLFLEDFKYLLEFIRPIDCQEEANEEIISQYFVLPTDKVEAPTKKFLSDLVIALDKDINQMNKEDYEQLNLKNIMETYFKYVKHFKAYGSIFKEKQEKKEIPEGIVRRIADEMQNYFELKANYYEDNVMNSLFLSDVEKYPHIEDIKKTISLDLLFRLNLPDGNVSLSQYHEKNSDVIESINKLFKTDPSSWQNIIVDTISTSKLFINSIIQNQLTFLFQFIFIEFNRADSKPVSLPYKNFLNLIEFLRLLCEDHNPIFQTLLVNYSIDPGYNNHTLINFILRLPVIVLTNIENFKAKKEFIKFYKALKTDYFNDLIEKLTDFLIEVIQGAFNENFQTIALQNQDFTEYYESHYLCMDSLENEEEYELILSQFFRFINCFIEENSNQIENKTQLIKKMNPKKLVAVAAFSFKKLYCKLHSEKENPNIEEKCHKLFIKNFINSEESFLQDPSFTLSTGIFMFLKQVASYKAKGLGEKYKAIIDNLEALSKENVVYPVQSQTAGEKIKLIKRELYLFCSQLVKEIEISFRTKNRVQEKELKRYKDFFEEQKYKYEELNKKTENIQEESKLEKVFFMVHPESLFLTEKDKQVFLEKAPYDNFNSKLTYVLEYYPLLSHHLQMRKLLSNYDSRVLTLLFHLNYGKFEVVSAMFSLVTCFLMIMSIKYTKASHHLSDPYSSTINFVGITHLLLLGMLILNWFTLNIIKFVKFNEDISGFKNTLFYFLGQLFDIEIFPFVWNFLFGFSALMHEDLKFLYALQLFTIFNIVPTMSTVLFAVRIRYKQFISTAFLLIILILFYSSVTFYFFTDREIEGRKLCNSYLECFLYLFNSGIRGGGVPFDVKILNQTGFWSEFIFSWIFYFIIILIIINIVNGIIVDTFQALREQNNEKEDVRWNVCFICSLNRAKFEIKRIVFEDHTSQEHNVLNYFQYLVKINRLDEHDLNSLDFQVFNSMKEMKTDFFPVKKAKCLE